MRTSGLVVVLLAAPLARAETAPPAPQLLPGMGSHHRAITTSSRDAQRWFDQGLTLAFAFNHDEAMRSFREAARLDPECAMAWWGVALVNGPHINNPVVDDEHAAAAADALDHARDASEASPLERELIDALATRYALPQPADRRPLDAAYAGAMRAVAKAHPDDADVQALFAEALMDLRPWDLWTNEGSPQPGTGEIVAALERALALDARHPGANHLLVHALEASSHPETALDAARTLRTLVPGAGHLVHMPAHVYARMGRWEDAARANVQAIDADAAYRKLSPRQGFYSIYMAHDHQFLAWVRGMQGRGDESIAAARDMVDGIPPEFAQRMAFIVDGYLPLPLEMQMRFGRWDDILAAPKPADTFPVSIALWRFLRTVSLAALGRVDEARIEQAAFEEAAKAVGPDAIVGNNPASLVLDVARHVAAGEIALADGRLDASAAALAQGAALEDTLRYDEPPDWPVPVRHALGAVLLRSGRFDEAAAAYRQDLAKWPENGWALQGLAAAERGRHHDAAARDADRRARRAFRDADVRRGTSCLCVARP